MPSWNWAQPRFVSGRHGEPNVGSWISFSLCSAVRHEDPGGGCETIGVYDETYVGTRGGHFVRVEPRRQIREMTGRCP